MGGTSWSVLEWLAGSAWKRGLADVPAAKAGPERESRDDADRGARA